MIRLKRLARHNINALGLVLGDVLALGLAFGAAFYLRAGFFVDVFPVFKPMLHSFEVYHGMWPILFLWVLMFAYEGLYPSIGMTFWEELRKQMKGNFVAFIVMVMFTFITQTTIMFSRTVIVMAFILSVPSLPLVRWIMRRTLGLFGFWTKEIMVAGSSAAVEQVLNNLRRHPDFGLQPVEVFKVDDDDAGGYEALMDRLIELEEKKYKAEELIVAMPGLNKGCLVNVVELGARIAPVVKVLPDLYGMASAGVETHDLDGMLLLEVEDRLALKKNRIMKRAFDIFFALLGIVILSPMFLIVALLVKLDSSGPVFFGHNRVGRHGHIFRCFKFRTMVVNAQEVLEELLASDSERRKEWEREFKLKDDPRITRVGNFLRKTSLDEFPQLWNVVRGDMSLVGPRPIVEKEVDLYGEKARYFFKVTPGITGLWQVSGRNDISYDERVLLDEYYAKNWSLWLDIEILFRTFSAVMQSRGAY